MLFVENFFREVEGILAFDLAVGSGDEFSWPSVVLACSWKREMSEQEEAAGKKKSLLTLLVGWFRWTVWIMGIIGSK